MHEAQSQLWQRGVTDAPQPPLANLQDVAHSANPYLELYHKLGPIYRLPREDKQPLVILAGAEANAFTSRYGDEFFVSAELWKEFNNAMGGMAGGMTTTRDGAVNRQRRSQAGRDYSRTKVLDQLPRMLAITHQYAQWQPGQSIEVVPSMQRIVAEQLGQLLVNYSIGDYLEDFVIYLSTSIVSSFGAKKRDALTSPRFQKARARVLELGSKIVAEHRATLGQRTEPDLVDSALAKAATAPEIFTETLLAYASLGPLLAGLETVARTNSFMLYALLNNPSVLARVQDEADNAFAQNTLTWDTLKSMTATQGAAMETLRLYTGGTFNAIVAEPFTFAGYRLDPGDEVHVAMTVPHHLPELYPHPERFDIDRYREPRNEHTCLGAGIAEIQLMVITATLLHTYEFELDPSSSQNPSLAIEDDVEPESGKRFHLKILTKRHL